MVVNGEWQKRPPDTAPVRVFGGPAADGFGTKGCLKFGSVWRRNQRNAYRLSRNALLLPF